MELVIAAKGVWLYGGTVDPLQIHINHG